MELTFLRTMLLEARTVRTTTGAWWLDRNPREGVRFERETPVPMWQVFNTLVYERPHGTPPPLPRV